MTEKPLTTQLNKLWSELLSQYPDGVSNTSTTKYNKIRELLAELLNIPLDQVYATGAKTRTSNLDTRFVQGNQAGRHTYVGAAFMQIEDVVTDIEKLSNSAVVTATKFVNGNDVTQYDTILIFVDHAGDLKLTKIIQPSLGGYYDILKEHFPDAQLITVGNQKKINSTEIESSFPEERMLSSKIIENFTTDAIAVNIHFKQNLVLLITSSLLAKKFLVLTGLSGSGKTKLAQAFSRWITPAPDWIDPDDPTKGKQQNPCYALIPVGADWTGNENIVGYPDGLQPGNYITRPALELIRHACEPVHAGVPHFLILDEMNLSHVERYFADLLSAIESGEEIPLYEGDERTSDGKAVPKKLRLPDNLFVIGTVNVDETTYMFSPKVLDRANVIEFRMEPDEFESFLKSPKNPKLEELDGKGAAFGQAFVKAATDQGREVPASANNIFSNEILLFFNLLRDHNAEFGYRTGYEAARFVHFYQLLGGYQDDNMDWFNSAMDAVIVQKFLPKLHGSRSRLEGLLWALAWACGAERAEQDGKDFTAQLKEASSAMDEGKYGPEVLWNKFSLINPKDPAKVSHYPLSYDKVMRMWRKLVRDQFVNFAEA